MMGCWNETCGVSRLPIGYGTRVVVIFLFPNAFRDDHNGGVYSTSKYKPLHPPFRGHYDDYGRIENIDAAPDITEPLRLWLQEHARSMGVGENTHHDRPVNAEMFETETVDEWVQACTQRMGRGRLIVDKLYPHNSKLASMMVREDVYEWLTRGPAPRDLETGIPERVEFNLEDRVLPDPHWVFGSGSGFFVRGSALDKSNKLRRHPETVKLLKAAVRISLLRQTWQPPDGSSQDYDWGMHARFHHFLQSVAYREMDAEENEEERR